MKEQLKKIFTNKSMWKYIIGFFVLIILLFSSYSKGLTDGILIDDDFKTVIIDRTFNDEKNDKKNAYISDDVFNDCLTLKISTYVGDIDNSEYVDSFVPLYAIDYNIYIYFDFKLLNNNNFSFCITDTLLFMTITDIYDNTIKFYNGDIVADSFEGNINLSNIVDFYGFPTFSRLPIFNTPYINIPNATQYVLRTSPDVVIGDYYYLDFFVNSTSIFQSIDISNLNDLIGGISLALLAYSYFPNLTEPYLCTVSAYDLFSFRYYTHDYLLSLFNNGGASQEDLQAAWQTGFDIGYGSGVIEGKSEFVNSQEYRDILDNKYNEGIDKGKEIRDQEYLQTQSFFDEVWNFVTNATEKTLAIFNINILPGIPLYFLIVIPIVLGLISWIFKLLQR